jgi:hypothetical protein
MQLIPKPEGVNFFFDFRVLGYPKLDMEGLMKILDPLIQAKEVPFNKWVSLSRDVEALASLQKGRDNENWQSLVDYLGSSPMQFSHDSFFRLKGPFHGSKGRKLLPTYIEAKQAVNGGLEIRKVVSLYDVHENDSLSIEVTSHSPHRSEEQEILSGIAKRNLSLEVEKDAPLSILGDKSVDLRQYTGQIVTLKAKRCEELDEKTGIVRFNTNLGPDEWPTGANFFLTFRIKKRTIQVVAALVAGVISVILGALGVKLFDKDLTWGVSALAIAVLMAVMTGLLYRGKLAFKI